MRVLFCASECAPLVKVGGLGDVAGALPKALSKLGVDIRVAIPLYDLIDRDKYPLEKTSEFVVPYARKDNPVTVYQTLLPGSSVLILLFENEEYLSGGGEAAFTGLDSEIRRFGFFDRALAVWLRESRHWQPDLIHLNDWHTSLIPHFVKKELEEVPAFLLTVHNLSYQGISSLDLFAETDLSIEASKVLSWDAQDKNVDCLLQGLAQVDVINTVSPTYAKEIMTPEFGEGLNEVLRSRQARVFGVLNGIDTESFNPETDEQIFKNYTCSNWIEGKRENKRRLQEKLRLPLESATPLISFIGRLEPKQKGLDLIEKSWGKLKKDGLQFVLLGVGDREWEKRFSKIAKKNPEQFSAQIKFDTTLARQLLAGSDMLLMPSKFEPCGLPQMMAMRYGTVPVAHSVGGLADTVEEGKTGFVFERYESGDLIGAVRRAISVYKASRVPLGSDDPRTQWALIVEEGMKRDFSWSRSARKYIDLYHKALEYRFGISSAHVADYRTDEIRGEWVVVAGERRNRPGDTGLTGAAGKPAGCPFDEGNEDQTPPEVLRIGRGAPNGPGWEVRVVPNKFPILPAHEVIIHSPDHEKDIAQLPLEQVKKIVQAYVYRFRFYDDGGLPYIFNNHGAGAGASLTHPHSQLVIFEKLPEALSEEVQGAQRYYEEHRSCPYCDLLKRESSGERFVWENSHFVVLVPFAAAWPYELLVLPKKHRENFSDIEGPEMVALAEVLIKLGRIFECKFGNPDYNFWIHSLSRKFATEDSSIFYHWHLEFVPRLKKLGAIELGAEVMIYDQATPEEAAKRLRKMFEEME